jgi:hypothetical protein
VLGVVPWNGQDEALLVKDREGRGDVAPFPFTAKGADVRGEDWIIVEG